MNTLRLSRRAPVIALLCLLSCAFALPRELAEGILARHKSVERRDAAGAGVVKESFAFPFQNYRLPLEERVNDLVGRLSLAEKIAQTSSVAAAVQRFNITAYNWRSNCLHGWAASGGSWAPTTVWTVFPEPIGLGATFDRDLVRVIGIATADEGRALHEIGLAMNHGASAEAMGLNCFAPNVNLFRDPRWGRGQETFGEDPFLISRMGVEYTRGLQEGDDRKYLKIAACAKHYAVHSGPESMRLYFEANVTAHDLYDTYLPAFKALTQEARVVTFMPAYNGINGVPDAANPYLLQQILRAQFGFDGATISDNGAVEYVWDQHHYVSSAERAAAVCMNAGTDMDLGNDMIYANNLGNAVKDGLVAEDTITQAVTRLMTIRFRLGDFDPDWLVPYKSIPWSVLDSPAHQQLNVQAARESIVLLKNDDSFLPLDMTKYRTVALIGPNANATDTLLGNYQGIPAEIVSVYQAFYDRYRASHQIVYAPGCENITCESGSLLSSAVSAASKADVAIVVLGLSGVIEREGLDRTTGFKCDATGQVSDVIGLPGCQSEIVSQIAGSTSTPIVLVLINGGPVSPPTADAQSKAVVEAWYPGALGGIAVVDVLVGDYNPGGRLPLTIFNGTSDLAAFTSYDMSESPGRTYRYYTGTPLYPFGFGLSYTTWKYSSLVVSPAKISPCQYVSVNVTLANTGGAFGDEVVQLYVVAPDPPSTSPRGAAYPTPKLSLQDFYRIGLAPGQSEVVTLWLGAFGMATVDASGAYMINPGQYTVYVGGQQPDLSSKGRNRMAGVLSATFVVSGSSTNIDGCSK